MRNFFSSLLPLASKNVEELNRKKSRCRGLQTFISMVNAPGQEVTTCQRPARICSSHYDLMHTKLQIALGSRLYIMKMFESALHYVCSCLCLPSACVVRRLRHLQNYRICMYLDGGQKERHTPNIPGRKIPYIHRTKAKRDVIRNLYIKENK